jgi:vancomycin resistance protein YoaR
LIGDETQLVELLPETVHPKELNVDTLYQDVCGDPVNATYKIENQKLIIVDEKTGVMFDKKEAEKIINEAKGEQVEIPIVTKKAEITAPQVIEGLFPDLLAVYTTKFNEGDAARSHNIRMACKSLNGVVMAPGDVFSYNDTLGPRTLERGYKMANVFVGNQVEPGLGGGICQVSSTLFNTVVFSDLAVNTRTSHSMPVSYVPQGRDATVSYGSLDFKFTNSTGAPIKLTATASNGQNTVKIYGVKKNPVRTVEMTTERLSLFPAEVVRRQDPTLEEGTVQVQQKGSDGSVYNTYKVTKENGSVIKSEFLTKSSYIPVTRVEIVGTKPRQTEAAASPEEELPVPDSSAAPAVTPVPPAGTGTSSSSPAPSAAPAP